MAVLALLGGSALMWRRRKPKALHLAAPVAETSIPAPVIDLPRLDLTLDITGATRSVMMFTLQYRLAVANRSDRAVTDLNLAVSLACARASANTGAGTGNAPSPGAAQELATIARIGPHQARSVTGEVRLPLSAIQPLRQGKTPLFVPLVHVTLEGGGDNGGPRAMTRSFVIGTPSTSGTGRLHPILLDQPPGSVSGLAAQSIAIPPISAAA